MSQEQDSSAVKQDKEEVASTESKEPKLVPEKAYLEKSRDMHKFKTEARQLKEQLAQYEAESKAREEAALMEENRWKELFEKEKQEKEVLSQQAQKEKEAFLKSVKLSALKSELGNGVKDQYLSFANVESIEFNEDGTVNKDSLLNVANGFRQDHSALIPNTDNANMTSTAPKINEGGPVDLSKLSLDEKIALMKQLDEKQ